MRNNATTNRPTVSVAIMPNGLYRAIATNGIGSASYTGIRPGSAIANALAELRADYPHTAPTAVCTGADMHPDDRRNWLGRRVNVVMGAV